MALKNSLGRSQANIGRHLNWLKNIGKQIRFATRREGGEQRSSHQTNEQRSRPINAVRKPDLFAYCLLTSAGLLLSLESFAGEGLSSHRLNFDYRAELGFIYLDNFDPGKISQIIQQSDSTQANQPSSSYRSFGLRRSYLDLQWTHLGSAELGIRLRPDAKLSRHANGEARELDTRAGQTYRPSPRIELLDTYYVAVTPGKDFQLGWGVFEGFEPSRLAYYSSLEFGLEARLPQKFAAYFVTWSFQPLETPRLTPKVRDTYRFTFWLYEGREDRRELLATKESSADFGPSAQDPFLGGALTFEAIPNEVWSYSLTAGYGDAKVDMGRVSEVFASISSDWQGSIRQKPLRIHWQSQWSKERWRVTGVQMRSLQQISHSLSSRLRFRDSWHLLTGVHWGVTQDHVEDSPNERFIQNGQQYDFGLEFHQGNFLNYQFMLASETRRKTEMGQRHGAFIIDDNPQRRLNRISVAVNYRIQ